jgi:glycosyltransferase involved in cell wall biosynthesis
VSTRSDSPKVSVVIPTYNRAAELRRCLESLKAQTFRDFEVLVCDDGSTDDTAAIAGEYDAVLNMRYEFAANSGGPAHPRNRGLRAARAPYLAFLDSDDWWTPEKLAQSVAHLDRGADVVYHDLYLVRKLGQRHFWRRVRTRVLHTPVFDDLLINGNSLTNSSVVIRTELLRGVGGISEERDLAAVEDYDAWLRVARVTEKFVRIDATLGYYWAGGGNISQPARMLRNLAVLQQRYSSEMDALDVRRRGHWLSYATGRAQYRIGDYAAARSSLARIRVGRAPLSIILKSLWMRLMIGGRRRSRAG